jgi:transcriptional regulator with XRE-family HTH domain
MTQYELGEKLNYSDKAISKWERGDGLPDAFVLKRISELFGVSVDYILTEHSEQTKKVETKPAKKAKALLGNVIMIAIATVALLLFVVVAIVTNGDVYIWQVFVYMLPALWIVAIVFTSILKHRLAIMLMVSALAWSVLAVVFVALLCFSTQYPTWMIFLLGIPLQIIIFLSFKIKISIKISQKPALIKTRDEEKE